MAGTTSLFTHSPSFTRLTILISHRYRCYTSFKLNCSYAHIYILMPLFVHCLAIYRRLGRSFMGSNAVFGLEFISAVARTHCAARAISHVSCVVLHRQQLEKLLTGGAYASMLVTSYNHAACSVPPFYQLLTIVFSPQRTAGSPRSRSVCVSPECVSHT
jgi:hypothetical protein